MVNHVPIERKHKQKANGGLEPRLGAELGSQLGRTEGCSARPVKFAVKTGINTKPVNTCWARD